MNSLCPKTLLFHCKSVIFLGCIVVLTKPLVLYFPSQTTGQNLFVGEFPGDLFDSLSQLTYLDLCKWLLKSSDTLIELPRQYLIRPSPLPLHSLSTDGNDLIGTLPTAIANLRNLEHLVLGKLRYIPSDRARLLCSCVGHRFCLVRFF